MRKTRGTRSTASTRRPRKTSQRQGKRSEAEKQRTPDPRPRVQTRSPVSGSGRSRASGSLVEKREGLPSSRGDTPARRAGPGSSPPRRSPESHATRARALPPGDGRGPRRRPERQGEAGGEPADRRESRREDVQLGRDEQQAAHSSDSKTSDEEELTGVCVANFAPTVPELRNSSVCTRMHQIIVSELGVLPIIRIATHPGTSLCLGEVHPLEVRSCLVTPSTPDPYCADRP